MINKWNVKMDIEVDKLKLQPLIHWNLKIKEIPKHQRKQFITDNPAPKESTDYLKMLYYEKGYGGETLRRYMDITKTSWRTLCLNYIDLELRKRGDITKAQREFRSERVRGDKNPFYEWTSKQPDLQLGKNWRGIQGWYCNGDKRIFLRSTWEYIYAKWLTSQNIEWKYEEKIYDLKNGERYKPDFFIYENNKLNYIVEVKGYHKKWLYKAKMFESEYNIKTIIIDNITPYCEVSYYKDKKIWKQTQQKLNQ